MKLNTLLQRLDQTVPLAFDTSLQNPEITSLQFDDDTTLSPHPTSLGKNVNGPDKNCPVLPNAYGCHLNSRIIRSFISV